MRRGTIWLLGALLVSAGACSQEQRWIGPGETGLTTEGTVTSFPMPEPVMGPTTIALAPDGSPWVTLGTANAIGRMDPNSSNLEIFELPHPDSSPRIIALGADGNMWFSEHTGNRIGRITPAGRITEFEIPTPASQPRAISLGADGNIWVGLFAVGKIARVTPAGEITEFEIPTPDSGPRALATGPDGDVWFSEFKTGKIGRITPDGEVTEYALPRANAGPGDITTGADGNLWFIELSGTMDGLAVDGNRVGRLTTAGDVTELEIPSAGPSPINIAVGPDRNIWFTKGATLTRVTPEGEFEAFAVEGSPVRTVGLTAGSDREPPDRLANRLWFTDPAGNRIGYLRFD